MENYKSYQKVINLSILPKSKPEKVKVSKPVKKRTKTGCFTCRKRKKKCDEIIEDGKCKNCTRNFLCCSWPTDRLDVSNDKSIGISTSVIEFKPEPVNVENVSKIEPISPNLHPFEHKFDGRLSPRMNESNERERKLSISSDNSINEPLTPKSPQLYANEEVYNHQITEKFHNTMEKPLVIENKSKNIDLDNKFIVTSIQNNRLCSL